MKLACALLYVHDLARMRAFYSAMLQAEPSGGEGWALFDIGAASLALHAIPAQYAQDDSDQAREDCPVKLIFQVDDVGAARARLEALGARIAPKPWQDPAQSCDCLDPEGNVFQIAARSPR